MPIYKGSTEVTSGNLYKGSTEVQDGYKATDPFYVNEATVTLNFSIVTGNASLAFSSTTITGVPGSSFSQITNNVTANSGYYISAGSCSDDNASITCAFTVVSQSLGQVIINGTIPSGTSTVNISVTPNTTAYIDVACAPIGNPLYFPPPIYLARNWPPSNNLTFGTTGNGFELTFTSTALRNAATVTGTRGSIRAKFNGAVTAQNDRVAGTNNDYPGDKIRVTWPSPNPSFTTAQSPSGYLGPGDTNVSVSIALPYRLVGVTSFPDMRGEV